MIIRTTLNRTCGPEVLQTEQTDRTEPGACEVWLHNEAIGVNYLDVTQRNGAVPIRSQAALGSKVRDV